MLFFYLGLTLCMYTVEIIPHIACYVLFHIALEYEHFLIPINIFLITLMAKTIPLYRYF